MFDIFHAITWVIEQIHSGWQGLRTAFQDALRPFLSIIRLLKHDVQMAVNERGEAAGGIVASATGLIMSLVTAVATSGGTPAFLAGIPRQLRAIAARIVKSVEQASSKLKLALFAAGSIRPDSIHHAIASGKWKLVNTLRGAERTIRRVRPLTSEKAGVSDWWMRYGTDANIIRRALTLDPIADRLVVEYIIG